MSHKRVHSSLNIKNVKYQTKRQSKSATNDLQRYKKTLDAQLKFSKIKEKPILPRSRW